MIIYEIGSPWNFDNFLSCKIWKFAIIRNWRISEIYESFAIFQIENFWNFRNRKVFEFFKLEIFVIFLITNFWNFSNCQFLEFWKLHIFQIANS